MLVNLILGVGESMFSLINMNPSTNIVWFCKMQIYVLQYTSMIYRWSLVAACFDRYALSSASVRLRNLATVDIARRVIAVMICIWLVLPIQGPILYNITAGFCGISDNRVGAFYHSIFTTILGCILPVLIMIICAILLYRNLILKQQRHQVIHQRQMDNQNDVVRFQHKRDRQVFLMLLIQVFVYMICITPLMTMNLYNAVTLNLNKSPDRITIESFIFYIADVIIFFFDVISFYLYTLVSKMFRRELKRLLYSVMTCKWNNTQRVVPTTNDIPLRIANGL